MSATATIEPAPKGTSVKYLGSAERVARGKAARAEVPRSSHAEWTPPPGRPDPVALLEEQAKSRVRGLVPIRYGRMAASPFPFFRGAAYVMASDLASTPRSGLSVQLCGDAHLSNLGAFAAPDRRLVFDLNDFDETLPGPWEWDVKRLAASLAVAGREREFDPKTRRRIVTRAVGKYREVMRTSAAMRNVDVWNFRIDVEPLIARLRAGLDRKAQKRADRNIAKARAKDSLRALSKLTRVVGGEPRFISDPPLIVPAEELLDEYGVTDREVLDETIRELLRSYRGTLRGELRHLVESYRYVDLARKVVGVGSVGTRAWIVLMVGRDNDDPLMLQVKEAERSVLEPFLSRSEFTSHGQRVVEGQRLMQTTSDMLLGWLRSPGFDGRPHDYYVRQLWDWKASAEVEAMSPATLQLYAELCAATLARAHARSGDRLAIAAYLGRGDGFDRAIAHFAEAYADQNELDHRALVDAITAGRVVAETGV
jgi:uncharacterized protein (DUF2252 family)